MDAVNALLTPLGIDSLMLSIGLMAALSLGFVLYVVYSLVSARLNLHRRAVSNPTDPHHSQGASIADQRRAKRKAAVDKLLKTFGDSAVGQQDSRRAQLLRIRLVRAGYYDRRAVAIFLLIRPVVAAVIGLATFLAITFSIPDLVAAKTILFTTIAVVAGYLAPNFLLDRRASRRALQVSEGFPDFMDLMVVCTEAGLSIEAAIERVGRELAESYPALAENLTLASLEIRAGRPVSDSLMRMAERVGIDEAHSLATLIQQSEKFGSSLAHSLRIYSDDMRNKRMMKAEEKAYALPAILTVPLMLFVFPVLLVTLMLPVIVRVSEMM